MSIICFVNQNTTSYASCESAPTLNGASDRPLSSGAQLFNTMQVIGLTQGKFAFIDDEDLDKVKNYTWHASKQYNSFYAMAYLPELKKVVRMHHLIMGSPPKGYDVDHKNHNGLDNRKFNLRICTHAKNIQNSKLSSIFKNYWNKNKAQPKYRSLALKRLNTMKDLNILGFSDL